MRSTSRSILGGAFFACLLASSVVRAAPPAPSGAHPRLFLNDTLLAALKTNAAKDGSAAASLIKQCQDTIDHPEYNTMRGGVDADTWPGGAFRCAFAYRVTGKAAFLTQAIAFWHASLDDDQAMGDKLGCTANVDTDWKNHWNGDYPPPPVLLTVTHDTGYPMRWYGPYLSLAYDWLYDAPGVDEALRAQTRTCLTAWVDWYTDRGYLNDVPAMNYNSGYVAAKTLASVAIGTDGNADGHLWKETVDDLFARILVGNGKTWTPSGSDTPVIAGLANSDETTLGKPVGPMVGGDWGSWEYGPLSVAELSASALVLEKNGVALPAMDAWVNSLALRYVHATVPHGDQSYCGDGDCGDGSSDINASPNANTLDAVLLGPSSDQAASWAAFMKQKQMPDGGTIWNALGEARSITPADYSAQKDAQLWYIARGSRTMFVRTAWQEDAFWGIFTSPPAILDHQHFSDGSFVFTRGGDHLVVDPAPYGGVATFESNGVSADAANVPGDYAKSQTPWSAAELVWARGTDDAVYAGRSDFAKAFNFASEPSDISYAHREWVMLPEGEIVTVDRVHTSAASRNAYISFHTNTGAGGLKLDSNGVASGTVGSSKVAIHPILLSGGKPQITQPPVGDCYTGCNYPCGTCEAVRFAVDKYGVTVPGPWAVAIHAIDGLASSDALATVGSLNDDAYDPAPKQNAGVIGAAVYRGQKQSYVVASSAMDGASPSKLTYGVPGQSPGRHIVFDAPEASDNSSSVTASAQGNRCVVTIEAGSGKGFTGHPLMFVVAASADGCTVKESTGVDPGQPPPGGGVKPTTGSSASSSSGSVSGGSGGAGGSNGVGGSSSSSGGTETGGKGCGCRQAPRDANGAALSLGALFALAFYARRKARAHRMS